MLSHFATLLVPVRHHFVLLSESYALDEDIPPQFWRASHGRGPRSNLGNLMNSRLFSHLWVSILPRHSFLIKNPPTKFSLALL